jgi:PAS domain S-box-containing protein
MFEGGVTLTKDAEKAIRYVALLGTPVFVLYGLIVMFGVVPSTNYINDLICLVILSLWLAVGIYHFFAPVRSKIDMLMRFVLYHALALATMLFITGFLQPFAASTALLFLASSLYYGTKGLIASIITVTLAALADIAMRYGAQPTIVSENLLGLSAILVIGVSIIMIISSQETRHKVLIKSQRQARLQSDRVETIMNNLTDATFSTDNKGRVQMYNAACLNLLDTNDSLKGKDISDLFTLTDESGKKVKLLSLLTAAQKTTRRDDIRHTYRDDEHIRIELTFAPIKSTFGDSKNANTKSGYVVIARDITKEKSLEEERDEFISVVSHELRTPITIVEGTLSNLQILLGRPRVPAKATLETTVETAHEQVLYLAKMVNDLSTLSRAERGVADAPEAVDVEEMIHRLHEQYQKDARDKKLHLDLDMGPKPGIVKASRLYLEELLQNFITNSIKYTEKGSVTIAVKQSKDMVLFTVKDTGIGISRGDQAKIFNKFYRSEDYRIRETSGTGLGLYVSQKLASKLGTTIELTSRLNHGSSFSFKMPVDTKK